MLYERHRRFLPLNDPVRQDPTYGEPELDPAPAPRTHEEADAGGKRAEAWDGPKCHHPVHETSIHWWCPLAVLAFFDLVKDFCPDMMHILKDFFSLHFILLFKGKRKPALHSRPRPELRVPKTGELTTAIRNKHKAKVRAWKTAKTRNLVIRAVLVLLTLLCALLTRVQLVPTVLCLLHCRNATRV